MLQEWFSQTAYPNASDPYFLYAASNAGSLIGLASYPFLLEPMLRNSQQALIWTVGYSVFMALTLACGLAAYRYRVLSGVREKASLQPAPGVSQSKLLWVRPCLRAGQPSVLVHCTAVYRFPAHPSVMGCSTWLVFAHLHNSILCASLGWLQGCGRLLPSAVVLSMVIFLLGFGIRPGGWAAVGLIKLFCFVVIALTFHIELARRRPGHQYLTEYYLWVSAGGILGGLLNAFIAPVLFPDFWEYPLTLVLAAGLLPAISSVGRRPVNLKFICITFGAVSVAGIALQFRSGSSVVLRLALLAVVERFYA